MKTNFTKALAALSLAVAMTSCTKNNKDVPENPGNFILAVTPAATTGVADYLLTAGSLESGTISTAGNGIEQDGSYRYYVTSNNKFFSMLYGQGNPGAVTTYNITNGKLTKISNFQSETVQAFAPVNDDILMFKIPRTIAATGNTLATWYRVNTNSLLIAADGSVNAIEPTGNGEIAHFSWIKQVGNKVYAPFFGIKNRSFETDYPDYAGIAVYSYPDMKYEKTIKDTRTSFIGRYFVDGLGLVENGDVYAFSSAVAQSGGVMTSTKPSAIIRIKSGTEVFDNTYFMNFETASNGYVITNWLYIGNNNFVAHIEPKVTKGAYATGRQLAIVNVVNSTVKLVSGLPAVSEISGITTNNYTPKDGRTAYVGVNLANSAGSYVYKIDAGTATATRGLKVEGGVITAIQHLQ
ncbi:DUF4374 domain-containing protein [Pedobacter africanus]|uniref:DUF4374 domain-containing protein n=1 Tax=Pedobacter africanus TaxID=151894 RepID=A0A1W2CKH5_9SPHI|nr:DUF4374 domain-containing protein [Pedobacter africanus]SMC85691.1 protein of unknown function [Pedobacter africanus]